MATRPDPSEFQTYRPGSLSKFGQDFGGAVTDIINSVGKKKFRERLSNELLQYGVPNSEIDGALYPGMDERDMMVMTAHYKANMDTLNSVQQTLQSQYGDAAKGVGFRRPVFGETMEMYNNSLNNFVKNVGTSLQRKQVGAAEQDISNINEPKVVGEAASPQFTETPMPTNPATAQPFTPAAKGGAGIPGLVPPSHELMGPPAPGQKSMPRVFDNTKDTPEMQAARQKASAYYTESAIASQPISPPVSRDQAQQAYEARNVPPETYEKRSPYQGAVRNTTAEQMRAMQGAKNQFAARQAAGPGLTEESKEAVKSVPSTYHEEMLAQKDRAALLKARNDHESLTSKAQQFARSLGAREQDLFLKKYDLIDKQVSRHEASIDRKIRMRDRYQEQITGLELQLDDPQAASDPSKRRQLTQLLSTTQRQLDGINTELTKAEQDHDEAYTALQGFVDSYGRTPTPKLFKPAPNATPTPGTPSANNRPPLDSFKH